VAIPPHSHYQGHAGNLLAREIERGLPFLPKRCFSVFAVPSKEVRGAHAHRALEQLLTCLIGSVSVVVDDAVSRQEVVLDSPELALYVPPMVWAIQYKYTADAVLLVMASDLYQADDYIRDYDQFLAERRALDARTGLTGRRKLLSGQAAGCSRSDVLRTRPDRMASPSQIRTPSQAVAVIERPSQNTPGEKRVRMR